MSHTRISYDKCSYKKRLQENKSIFKHVMNPHMYENSSKCRVEFGIVSGNDVSLSGNTVDLESELFGLNQPISNCAKNSFNANKFPKKHLPTCQLANFQRPAYPKPTYNQTCIER